MKRVVITGIGTVTSLGKNSNDFWESILEGKNGITKIEKYDTEEMGVNFAGQINDFDPVEHGIDKKVARRMDRFIQLAVAASNEAIEMSGFNIEEEDPFKVGVIMGTGIGGFSSIDKQHRNFVERGAKKISVFFVPMMICNMSAGAIAIEHGYKGANFATVTACASSNHAVGEAYRNIKHGYLDACVAGGSESTVDEFGVASFNVLGALSRAEDINKASIPFDKDRNGFVMAEGGAVLFLEEYEHAKKRGANIIAEIVGYGATCDAYHITSPAPDGAGASKAMELAINEANINIEDIDYINAHGTSTKLNDLYETRAIKKLFGEHAYKLAVSSTKSMTGHLLGAAGALETIITAKSLQQNKIPSTINLVCPDEECDLDYVKDGTRDKEITYALTNSLGFGGHNATICLKKFTD